MYIVGCYLAYAALSFTVTVWVARTLHKNGRIFLVDVFGGNAPMADSVNDLLVVGFYLINIGWILITLKSQAALTGTRGLIELLSDKLGIVLLVLGAMHFLNLYVFSRLRRRPCELQSGELRGGSNLAARQS